MRRRAAAAAAAEQGLLARVLGLRGRGRRRPEKGEPAGPTTAAVPPFRQPSGTCYELCPVSDTAISHVYVRYCVLFHFRISPADTNPPPSSPPALQCQVPGLGGFLWPRAAAAGPGEAGCQGCDTAAAAADAQAIVLQRARVAHVRLDLPLCELYIIHGSSLHN